MSSDSLIALTIKAEVAEAEYEHAQRMRKEAALKLGDARTRFERAETATAEAFARLKTATEALVAFQRKRAPDH